MKSFYRLAHLHELVFEGSRLFKILAEGRRVRGRVRRGYVAARRIQEIQDFEKQSGKNEVTWGKKWLGTTKKSSKRVFGAQGEPPRGSQESQAIGKARRNEKKSVGKGCKWLVTTEKSARRALGTRNTSFGKQGEMK